MQESSDHADVKHPSQYYNILYSSNTGEASYHNITDYDETEWTRSGFNYNERHCFIIIPMNDFLTGEQISMLWCVTIYIFIVLYTDNSTTNSEYQCQPSENSGLPIWAYVVIILMTATFLIIVTLVVIIGCIIKCRYKNQRNGRKKLRRAESSSYCIPEIKAEKL